MFGQKYTELKTNTRLLNSEDLLLNQKIICKFLE